MLTCIRRTCSNVNLSPEIVVIQDFDGLRWVLDEHTIAVLLQFLDLSSDAFLQLL